MKSYLPSRRAAIITLSCAGTASLIFLAMALAKVAVLIDEIPGGDAGLATSPELQLWQKFLSAAAIIFGMFLTSFTAVLLTYRRKEE